MHIVTGRQPVGLAEGRLNGPATLAGARLPSYLTECHSPSLQRCMSGLESDGIVALPGGKDAPEPISGCRLAHCIGGRGG